MMYKLVKAIQKCYVVSHTTPTQCGEIIPLLQSSHKLLACLNIVIEYTKHNNILEFKTFTSFKIGFVENPQQILLDSHTGTFYNNSHMNI